jgi:hypothetical protein
MYDTGKSKKFFLRWYDGVPNEKGVARVLWGEVEVWSPNFSERKNAKLGRKITSCNYARPAGVYGVPEFYNFTEEDSDLPTCTGQLISGVKHRQKGRKADLVRS